MVTKFLNKYFPVYKTNAIRREISGFTQRKDEQFFETTIQWATFEVSTSWVQEMAPMPILFGGLLPHVQEWLMTTSGGELMSKSVLEIWEFFHRQADNSQQRS